MVFALSEKGLFGFTGSDKDNPTLDLPCREVFAHGQKPIEVVGPLLEEEARRKFTLKAFWTRKT